MFFRSLSLLSVWDGVGLSWMMSDLRMIELRSRTPERFTFCFEVVRLLLLD